MKCEDCGKSIDKRTTQQNRALHLFFQQLADALNEAGYDMRETIREEIDIPWNAVTIKEYLWRPVMKKYIREQSTTKLSSADIDKIFDIINKMIGERTGVYVPFPSIETMYDEFSKITTRTTTD